MDAEFSRLVKNADDIAASGRWANVNERIKNLAAKPGKDSAWWVQVFGCLCAQVFSEYLLLRRAHKEPETDGASVLAWRARNLLELSVWCLYCSKSTENARRLYEDAGRDVLGLFAAFTKWGAATAQEPEWLDLFTGAAQDVSQRAAAAGIESLEGGHKRVSDAARECGIAEHFSTSYRMLSKFAHPTAMQILASPNDAKVGVQRDCFFSQGCLFFTGAFGALEGQLI